MVQSGKAALIVTEVRHTTTQLNIALSKDNFAELVAKKKAPFDNVDLTGFEVILTCLRNIRQQWLEDRTQPF